MHYLLPVEELFFKNKVTEVNNRIQLIIEQNQLQGKWTLSADFKWLVKVED